MLLNIKKLLDCLLHWPNSFLRRRWFAGTVVLPSGQMRIQSLRRLFSSVSRRIDKWVFIKSINKQTDKQINKNESGRWGQDSCSQWSWGPSLCSETYLEVACCFVLGDTKLSCLSNCCQMTLWHLHSQEVLEKKVPAFSCIILVVIMSKVYF